MATFCTQNVIYLPAREGEKILFGALHCMMKDNFIEGKRLSREHSIQMLLLLKITRLGYNEFLLIYVEMDC